MSVSSFLWPWLSILRLTSSSDTFDFSVWSPFCQVYLVLSSCSAFNLQTLLSATMPSRFALELPDSCQDPLCHPVVISHGIRYLSHRLCVRSSWAFVIFQFSWVVESSSPFPSHRLLDFLPSSLSCRFQSLFGKFGVSDSNTITSAVIIVIFIESIAGGVAYSRSIHHHRTPATTNTIHTVLIINHSNIFLFGHWFYLIHPPLSLL